MRSAITIILALVLLSWSIATTVIDVLYTQPYREVAEELETGRAKAPDSTFLDRIERSLGGDWVQSLCSREITRSIVTIELASLEAAYRQKKQPELAPDFDHARAVLTRALKCMPGEGNFWLRLAIVNFAAGGTQATVEEQLTRSLAAAPSEAWISMPRLAFAAQLGSPTPAGIDRVVRIDASNLVKFAREWDLARYYVTANAAARAAIDEQVSRLDETRRAELTRAITAAKSEVSGN